MNISGRSKIAVNVLSTCGVEKWQSRKIGHYNDKKSERYDLKLVFDNTESLLRNS